jgi:hypothetical protein
MPTSQQVGAKIKELFNKLDRAKKEQRGYDEIRRIASAICIGFKLYDKITGRRTGISISKLLR